MACQRVSDIISEVCMYQSYASPFMHDSIGINRGSDMKIEIDLNNGCTNLHSILHTLYYWSFCQLLVLMRVLSYYILLTTYYRKLAPWILNYYIFHPSHPPFLSLNLFPLPTHSHPTDWSARVSRVDVFSHLFSDFLDDGDLLNHVIMIQISLLRNLIPTKNLANPLFQQTNIT